MSSPADSPPVWLGTPADMSENVSPRNGIVSSSDNSQPGSGGQAPRPQKKRVGWGSQPDSAERSRRVSWTNADGEEEPAPVSVTTYPPPAEGSSIERSRSYSEELLHRVDKSHLPELSPQQTQEIHAAFSKPRPAMRRHDSTPPDHLSPPQDEIEGPDGTGQRAHRQARMREAFERGKRLEQDQISAGNSRRPSPQRPPRLAEDIEMDELGQMDEHLIQDEEEDDGLEMPVPKRRRALENEEAHRLVRRHTRARREQYSHGAETPPPAYQSGAVTPTELEPEDYRAPPREYRGGILGSLLKLYNEPQEDERSHRGHHSRTRSGWFHSADHTPNTSTTPTPQGSPPTSGTATPTGGSSSPKNWFRKNKDHSSASLSQLVGTTASLGSPIVSGLGEQVTRRLKEQKHAKEAGKRPNMGMRSHSSNALAALNRVARGKRMEEEARITVHIAETIARQRYLMRLCRALMQYGAPTHRLEEYMRMSARVLEIDAQFLYIPGSMIISFDDPATHTTEVKLVRVSQGLDLGKLRDVHETYKDVVHDKIGVEEATSRLKEIMNRKDKHSRWLRIPVYGLAAVCVGPFAFQARLIDLPIAFILGCILGVLQLVVSPASDLYANVFEIMATVITSFLARAFGSIPYKGGYMFCFSALAQSSIALILPGYIVLCASLELQSKSIVAGSIRMVYAVIYTLFLGYGITIGTAIYGIIDKNATSQTTCSDPIPGYWVFFFVPGFTLCLIIINQAKWKQAPVMLIIAFVGYLVNYFSAQRFLGNTQVSNTLGALAIGVMANFYSRVGSRIENWSLDVWEDTLRPYWKRFRSVVFGVHSRIASAKSLEDGTASSDNESMFKRQTRRVGYSLAAAAMLPAIFVQVPSGLAVNGSLVSGIASANQISGNATNGTQVLNTSSIVGNAADSALNSLAFNVSYSVIQVAIGITVGLFLSAIVVYPTGKRRSGLFSL